jgi:nucleoside-diphosphate-sugar epimerase
VKPLPQADLDIVAKYFQENNINLEKASFLISGVTGFVGSWLLDSLMHINKEFGLKIEITGITRNASKVDGWVDLASAKNVHIIESDIRTQKIIEGSFTHVVHAATPTTTATRAGDLGNVFESSVIGARNLLEIAKKQDVPPIFLHTSSGAIYEKSASSLEKIPLSWPRQDLAASDVVDSEYARAKIETEKLIEAATIEGTVKGINARLFSFMGPRVPLQEHYSIGNFMHSGMYEDEINLSVNPATVRSYEYAADMASTLIYVLGLGQPGTFHIGSDKGHELLHWAELVGKVFSKPVKNLSADLAKKPITIPYIPEHDERIPRGLGESILIEEQVAKWRDWLLEKR